MKKILQLSDIHIGTGPDRLEGIDIEANFRDCLADGARRGADLALVNGDLCLSAGEPGAYEWIRAELDACGLPWLVLPGNHDDTAMINDAFGLGECYRPAEREIYRKGVWEDRPVYLLDTAAGDISRAQAEWLRKGLAGDPAGPEPLVFMHHPPMRISVPFMDDTDLPSPDTAAFFDVLAASRSNINIFVGHYHVEKTARFRNATIYVGPSTYFQIDQFSTGFNIDHVRPGYRLIEVHPDRLLSACHYLGT